MNVLDRSVSELSIQIERLKASNQELERKLDAMRANYNQRLDRLEKGAVPPARSRP
jgi:chaperonin cofactor prefoldin